MIITLFICLCCHCLFVNSLVAKDHSHNAEVPVCVAPPCIDISQPMPQWACLSGQQIPALLRCDGLMDCADGSDEAPAECNEASLEPFNEGRYHIMEIPGFKLDPVRHANFTEMYHPILSGRQLPQPGPLVDKVEMYYLDAPHHCLICAVLGWAHFGIGFKLLDSKGEELGRIMFQYWSPDLNIPRQWLIDIYLGKRGLNQSDPINQRPSGDMLWYDDRGRLLFEQRGMVTWERSRFNWEGGYWQREQLHSTLDIKKFGRTMQYIEKWAADHPQFSQFGVLNMQKEVIFPLVGCHTFVRDTLLHVSDVDILNLSMPVVANEYIMVEPVELGADARRLEEMMKEDPELHLVNVTGLAENAQVDTKAIIVLPASYHANGSVWEGDEYVARVHILRPTHQWHRIRGVGATLQISKYTVVFWSVVLLVAPCILALICWLGWLGLRGLVKMLKKSAKPKLAA